jgi:type II secretion system protein H
MKNLANQFRGRSGFSLIELVLVVVIVAVFAAMAIPRYTGARERYQVDLAARRVSADLQLAQLRARASGQSRTLTFTRSSSSYQLSGESDLSRPASAYIVQLTAEPYRSSIGTVNFSNAATLSFNGWGVPSAGGSLTVQSGGLTRTVSVNANTGAVTIQ